MKSVHCHLDSSDYPNHHTKCNDGYIFQAANSDALLDFTAKLRPIIDLAASAVQMPKVKNSSLDLVEQLTRLAELKAAGPSADTEFEIAKSKLPAKRDTA